ncbi:MAG: acyl-CoA dehydrogenase family protein, partial [Leptospira sp.]|nr:acyl-CoA dehydrogenase family protein [Leptospira sp.]
MIQNNYFSDVSDIKTQFEEIIDWKEIVENYENAFEEAKIFDETGNELYASAPHSLEEAIEYYRVILDAIGDIAGNIISRNVREMEKQGLQFDNGKVIFPKVMIDCVNKVKEAGLQPYGFGRKYGGLGLPFTVKSFMNEILYRVDASVAIAIGCVNLAEIIEKHANEEMKSEWIPKMAQGEFCCAMGLTEPNHGSDLPNITTKATKSGDGKWILNGTKRFITQACGFDTVPAVILTLARTGELNSGARGLSFFLVHSKDIQIASIENKMGLHCSPTCEVVLENTPAELIGEEGYGLIKYVIGMLNGARMGIAYQSTGIATAAFHEAEKYARERIQFGKPIIEIPAVRKILNRMERETSAMRCISLEGSRVIDLYYWRSEHLKKKGLSEKEISSDEQVRFHEKLANL